MGNMEKLITLKDVYKIYGEDMENEVRAIDGVNLIIEKGEFVAIVGSSGSGKSTLMNILGCLDVPTYGEYIFNGVEISELTDRELSKIRNRQIGFIFQGFNLISALNAYENVELPLIYGGIRGEERHDRVIEALERVGLNERVKHKPAQMSGGQQQRVAIARAIATNPSIIMADEPTGNLDSKTGAQVMDILRQLNRDGATIILITHDNDIAEQAGRAVRVMDGKIVEDITKNKAGAAL